MKKILIDVNDFDSILGVNDINVGLKYYDKKQGFVNTTELSGFMDGLIYARKSLIDWILTEQHKA